MDELRAVAESLYLEYSVEDNVMRIYMENFKDKFELICKVKEKWTIVIKLKNGQYEKKYCFYNKEKLKSFICCQYVLECFQNA